MTRENSIKVYMMNSKRILAETLVDIDSRTCENCKHYIDENGTVLQFCNAITDGGIIGWNAYGKDFGCNKFERKDKHNEQHGDRLDKIYYGNKG